jgi:hypothetical protein
MALRTQLDEEQTITIGEPDAATHLPPQYDQLMSERSVPDLSAMMAGANEVLREAGCALVGGHTSEGAELALGFAVNGLVSPKAVLRKGGLRPGDALILTKPIGTGTLLAADMRRKAKARWVMAAITHMIQSNGRAAEILRRHGVHAATDVTGFGLLGHLVEMVRASDVDVTIAIDRVPLLDGARETVALGIFSSLQPQNVRLRRAIRELETVAMHPVYPLLFDPQTSGVGKQDFRYLVEEDVYICPAAERLTYSFTAEENGLILRRYSTNACTADHKWILQSAHAVRLLVHRQHALGFEDLANVPRILIERCRQFVQPARPWQVDIDDFNNASRPRSHDHNAIRQQDCFRDAMRDVQGGFAAVHPEPLDVHRDLLARERVERAERLVHQQQARVMHQRATNGNTLPHAAR